MKTSVLESMKHLTVKDIIILVLLLALGVTIFLCKRKTVKPLEDVGPLPDTIYLPASSYKPITSYKRIISPKLVTVYIPNGTGSKLHTSKVLDSLSYLQGRDSITQILLSKDQLRITSSIDSDVILDKVFGLNLDKYKYNYTQGKLTRKLNIKNIFGGDLSLNYRPFHNLWDLDIGAHIKTKSLQYKVGVNLYYYPKYEKNLGTDLKFTIQYNF